MCIIIISEWDVIAKNNCLNDKKKIDENIKKENQATSIKKSMRFYNICANM